VGMEVCLFLVLCFVW